MEVNKPKVEGMANFIKGAGAEAFKGDDSLSSEAGMPRSEGKRGVGRPPTGRASLKDPIKTSLHMEKADHQFFSIEAIKQGKGLNDLLLEVLLEWKARQSS